MKVERLLLYAAALFLALATSTAAFAEVRQGAVTVSPFVGGYLFEGDQRLKTDNFMFGTGVGYLITDHIGIEGVVGYINGRRKPEDVPAQAIVTTPDSRSLNGAFLDSGPALDPHRGRVHGFIYKVEGLYHFNPAGKFVPFVAAGVGGLTLDPKEGTSRTSVILDYGAGIQYFLSNNLAFRADVRHVFALNEGENNLLYTAGLAYYIGGGKPAPAPVAVAPPPPPAPAPVPPAPKVEAPAPPPAQKNVCIVLTVLFDFDKSDIKPEYHDDIKQVSDFLNANPTFKGVVEGNTDAVGTEDYNMDLSQRRAESVKKYLVDNFGIAADRLEAVGFGKYMPAATNLTEEGRQLNRRSVRVYCSLEGDIPEPPLQQYCVGMKVEFDSGSAEIKPQYDSEIRRVAEYMKEHPTEIGTVEGYADGKGSEEYNMKLSQKRADAVKKYLVDKYGVPDHRIKTKALGKTRPIADNSTPEGRAQNRYAVEMFCSPE